MPSLPDFDYYQELQLDRTASIEDIKASYRRLALIHHPDKNPDNLVEATAAFQKIQTAYETLSEERSRAIYDARSSGSTARPSDRSNGYSAYDSDNNSEFFDDDEEEIDMSFEEFMHARFAGGHPGYSSRGTGDFRSFFQDGNFGYNGPHETSAEEIRKRREEREAAEDRHMEYMKEQARQRAEMQEMLAKARYAAKVAEEKQRVMQKEKIEEAERARNEMRWAAGGATTKDQKQALCFHSENWAKEKFQKKVKCEACDQKRGIVGHRCPHCSLLACQVCVNTFNELRKAL